MIFNDNFYSSLLKKRCFIYKKETEQFIQNLYNILFGTGYNKITTKEDLDNQFSTLRMNLKSILYEVIDDHKNIEIFLDFFFDKIPYVYDLLLKDAEFFKKSDPASVSIEEVKIAYPGFFAIVVYRFASILYDNDIPLLPRILSEYAHSKTGIDIHPGATIGNPFMIDHGTGIVIGETTEIGNNVKIFQGVTLGALSVSKNMKNQKRHPTIKDSVIIYAGATILGGNTIIGENTIIGGNVWLTESIEANSKVFNNR